MLNETPSFLKMGFFYSCRQENSAGVTSSRRINGAYKEGSIHRIPRFKLHDLHLATNRFDLGSLVASAALSQTYRARLCHETLVFVKKAWPGDRYWDAQLSLENERSILSTCRGRYLLNLVGVSDDTPERVLILEHANCGNLFDALHNNALGAIEWPARFRIAHHVAVAIRGLHGASSQIVHRDVTSLNVWINENWSAKLGGFDFSLRFCSNKCASSLNRKCPHKAMSATDPDYQGTQPLCAKTDTFCFGLLLLEIITGRRIMDVKHHPPFVLDWALPLIHQNKVNLFCDSNMRPPFRNSKAVLDTARIAARCVNTMSVRRPTMAEVAEDLKMLTLRVPLDAQKCYKRGADCNSMASMCTIQPTSVKGAVGTKGFEYLDSVKVTGNTQAKQDQVSMFRCERPSMLFGRIALKTIPPRSYLGVLKDAAIKKQIEPHLPPHLRHNFT